jgi:hypothetical protein
MKSPYPTLSNACVAVCEYVAFRQTYSLTPFTLFIDRPFLYFVSCLVVVLGMRVLRPFAEKYSLAT